MARQFSGTITNRWLGTLMLACGALMILAMLHHPDAVNGNEVTSSIMRWVHGVLIFLIIINAYAVWRFVDQVQNKANDLVLGAIFYWIGVAAFLGGTLVSGFVQSGVSDLYAAEALSRDTFGAFSRFSAILNQTLIKFGLLSFGASGLIWTFPLISSSTNTKIIAVSGFIVGTCIMVSVLLGLSLSVFSMTILTSLIVLWHGSIALWFLRNNNTEGLLMAERTSPIALAAFEELAHAYARIAETKAENGYNEHPAIRSRIGDVSGLAVLDAGCGPGFLVRDLINRGAVKVVGFDVSPTMIEIAAETAGENAELFVADLAKPLDLPSDAFDLITSSLAIDYVRDWSVPLAEFKRLLKNNGRLVMSVQHPMGAYRWYSPPSAFGVHLCEAEWTGFTEHAVTVPDYYRSFEEIINPILSAGFALAGIQETKPVETLREINPDKYRRGSTFPTFIVIDACIRSVPGASEC